MKLDHINLTVHDVEAASRFLKAHFGYADAFEDNNAGMAVLMDGSGGHINLMKGSEASYPKLFHIGFDFETEAQVDAQFERLRAEGVALEPPKHAWGAWTFAFPCPGGEFFIEVACASEG